jgi:CRP-like cAMP-binding protein
MLEAWFASTHTPMTAQPEIASNSRRHDGETTEEIERANKLLSALPSDELSRIRALMEHVPLPLGTTLYQADTPIDEVYFLTSGMVSIVSEMDEGTVEVGTVGREGMAGLPIVLDADSMPVRAFMQVGGAGLRMRSDDLRRAMREHESFARLLRRYALALFDQAAQSAACNRLHALESRCAKWLLMSHDRVDGDVLPLKQVFLAEMLGVHRPAVTVAASALQRAGFIKYSRGKVTVLDRAGLEAAACACYAVTARSFARVRDAER